MLISEIFASIQGESTHAGRPCTFVRTVGCDQRCEWCDTAYAFDGGKPYSLTQLYDRVEQLGLQLVEVTGGEPLLQDDMGEFLTGLCDRGFEVLLETGGSLPIAHIDPRVKRIVDLKPPASAMTARIHWPNLAQLRAGDELKFVITDRGDYDWSVAQLEKHPLPEGVTVLFSPAFGIMDGAALAEWVVADRLPVRMQLQMHKYIWSPEARGV